jgi:hypothetical protein
MNDYELWEIARKRAGYALAKIADLQMTTWTKFPSPETAREIIAAQVAEAMNDMRKACITRTP